MLQTFKSFFSAEDGAVTVDWVVLTAAVVGLAVTAIFAIQGPTDNVGDGVGDFLTAYEPGDH